MNNLIYDALDVLDHTPMIPLARHTFTLPQNDLLLPVNINAFLKNTNNQWWLCIQDFTVTRYDVLFNGKEVKNQLLENPTTSRTHNECFEMVDESLNRFNAYKQGVVHVYLPHFDDIYMRICIPTGQIPIHGIFELSNITGYSMNNLPSESVYGTVDRNDFSFELKSLDGFTNYPDEINGYNLKHFGLICEKNNLSNTNGNLFELIGEEGIPVNDSVNEQFPFIYDDAVQVMEAYIGILASFLEYDPANITRTEWVLNPQNYDQQ